MEADEPRHALVRGTRRDDCQMGARAVAANGQPVRREAELQTVFGQPDQGIESVFARRGKGMLGRKTVVHARHRALGIQRQPLDKTIVRFEIPPTQLPP